MISDESLSERNNSNLCLFCVFLGIGKVLGNRHKTGDKVIITNGDKTGSYVKYELEIREADKV